MADGTDPVFWHMPPGWGWGMTAMHGFGWLFFLLIVVVLVLMVARAAGGPSPLGGTKTKSARDILDARYAAGEIDRSEYLEKKKDLT